MVRPADQQTVLEPIRRERLHESIVAQIQRGIERGELKPGDQLPPERALAEQLQVSRASVREALRSLEPLGVTESRPGGGTFIRQVSPDDLLRPLAALTKAHDLREILEVREILEPSLAALAAERATADDIVELHRILRQQEAKLAAGESYVEEDTQFHYTVARAAKNALVLRMLHVIWDALRGSRDEWLQSPTRARASLDGHRALLRAVEARDHVAARAASTEHLTHVGTGLLAIIDSDDERPTKKTAARR